MVALAADVRALEPTQDGQIAITAGALSLSDRGGGTWVYIASDTTSSDNTGTILVTPSGKRWRRVYNGYVSPEWWGAKGGTVDDSAAFTAAAAVGDIVLNARLYTATFQTSRSIHGTTGYSGDEPLCKINGTITLFQVKYAVLENFAVTRFIFDSIWRCKFIGLRATAPNGSAVVLKSTVSVFGSLWNTFLNCNFRSSDDGAGIGLDVQPSLPKSGINNNGFYNCQFVGGLASGSSVKVTSTNNTEFEANTFDTCDFSLGFYGMRLTGLHRSTHLTNSYFEDNTYSISETSGESVEVRGGVIDRKCQGNIYYYNGARNQIGAFAGGNNINKNPRMIQVAGIITDWTLNNATASTLSDSTVWGGSVTRVTTPIAGTGGNIRKDFSGIPQGNTLNVLVKVKNSPTNFAVSITSSGIGTNYLPRVLEKDGWVLHSGRITIGSSLDLIVTIYPDGGSGAAGAAVSLVGCWIGMGAAPRDFEYGL
jgi:hypothetical protein